MAADIRRFTVARTDYAANGEDLFKALCASALTRTVSIVENEMPYAIIYQDHNEFLAACLSHAPTNGAHCEFGVYSGNSITFLSERRPMLTFDGFDSFLGLPEEWKGYRSFDFNRGGTLPTVRQNVRLHVALFDMTLPNYSNSIKEVAFLHVDCDLYTSTVTVFKYLGPKLIPGSVIVFDEYFGYPGFEHHERKAFSEFLVTAGRKAEWFACCGQRAACAVR